MSSDYHPSSSSAPDETRIILLGAVGRPSALNIFLAHLPKNLPAPLIIVTPEAEPVTVPRVDSGSQLQPGTISVVPAHHSVRFQDGRVFLETAESSTRPIDAVFASAAQAYGAGAIAVLLSGTNPDGISGVTSIKRAGGIVLLEHSHLPTALADTSFDAIGKAQDLGSMLESLLRAPNLSHSQHAQHIAEVLSLVKEHCDIDFSKYKSATIERRLARRIVLTDTQSLPNYIAYLRAHPEEYPQLVNHFLISVTSFFRDPELFEELQTRVLPRLVSQARNRDHTIRIWSAGCSTGEEAYSIGIVLTELLGKELPQFHIRIFATDISRSILQVARRGIYPQEALADLSPDRIARAFVRLGDHWQVNKTIRAMTVFGEHDLAQRAPFPHLDLVVCRNVLIYFTPELQRRALHLFAFSLREGGILFLGKAETPSRAEIYFHPCQETSCPGSAKIFERNTERSPSPHISIPFRPIHVLPYKPPFPHLPKAAEYRLLSEPEATGKPQNTMPVTTTLESILKNLPIGVLLIDRDYHIIEINASARTHLRIFSAIVGDDLIHLTDHLPRRLFSDALSQACQGITPIPLDEIPIPALDGEGQKFVQIAIHPRILDGAKGRIENILLLITDITELVAQRHSFLAARTQDTPTQTAHATSESSIIAELRQRLKQAEDSIARLTEISREAILGNQQLAIENEELRLVNQSLSTTAEEAQSATEESVTLNEELQSGNEELETLNEELHATIEELNATNADLDAQTKELARVSQTAETERTKLNAVLRSIRDAVAVVDPSGTLVFCNGPFLETFGSCTSALDDHGNPLASADMPLSRAAKGEIFEMDFSLAGNPRRYFSANGSPVCNSHGEVFLAVVVIREITQRKQSEDELRHSEEKYRLLFENIIAGFALHEMIFDDQGRPLDYRYLEVNPAFERLTGVKASQLIGKTVKEVMPDTEQYWIDTFGKVAKTGVPCSFVNYAQAIGRYFDTWSFCPIPGHFAVVFTDVTERIKAEEALKESEARFRLLAENASDFISRHALDGICLYASPACTRLFGYEPQDLVGHVPYEFYHPDDVARVKAQLHDLPASKGFYTLEARLRCKDGTYRWIESVVHVVHDPDTQKPAEIHAVARDITQRKQTDEVLFKQTLSLKESQRIARVGSYHLDLVSGIWTASETLDEIFGIGPEFIHTVEGWSALIHPDDRERIVTSFHNFLTLKPHGTWEPEYAICRKNDGQVRQVIGRGNIIYDLQGNPASVVGIVQDITERYALEERLRHTEKLDAIGQLAGGIAHDFNNQLASILGFAQILETKLSDDTHLRYVRNIEQSALRSADLTKQLLAFARKGKYISVPVQIHALIHEVISLLGHTLDKKISIHEHLNATDDTTRGDPSQLQNAILNLAINARDAMPKGGTLTFTTSNVVLKPQEIDPDIVGGTYVYVQVADTGIGMNTEVIAHLFEPFFTTKPQGKGTGLGLPAVYGAMKNHKGAITVLSTPGNGSTFSFYLPLLSGSPESASKNTRSVTDHTHNILFVDDEANIRSLVSDMLQFHGHTVCVCSDGQEAITTFQARPNDFDLVILDLIMPKLSGHETFRALRAINPKIKVLLCSGYSLSEQAQEILEEGAVGFLQKPFLLEELHQKIAEVL